MTELEQMLRAIIMQGPNAVDPAALTKAMAPKTNGNGRKPAFRFTEPKTFEAEQLNGMLDAIKALYGQLTHIHPFGVR